MRRRLLLLWVVLLAHGNLAAQTKDIQPPVAHIYIDIIEAPTTSGVETPAVQRLKQYLAGKPGFNYRLHYVSWPKAIEQLKRSDALIFQLLRTPAREQQYHWLYRDSAVEVALYSLREHPWQQLPLPQLLQIENILIGCADQTAHCDLLQSLGFNSKQIQRIKLNDELSIERMLFARRVDFIVTTAFYLEQNRLLLGRQKNELAAGIVLARFDDYLAAGKSFDAGLLQLLAPEADTANTANTTRP
ncbi:hypothetical protein EOE67_18045 [Rheinheimera riviphila]|uniref:Transporter substrate-binding domain-containing protein n=1 Tax=Rheinheimera riviphila TaxID=1834037 RepID=A0A437QF23_9GAMM|nr:hypothetical protein [Rheinheimera riviphila]RVU33140.1 hypothetical protein EOE67_18045 [Rheinheimera riviphila]